MTTETQDAIDARRWRALKQRHGVKLLRMATGSVAYSSERAPALLDAWADMAVAEIEAYDPDLWRRETDAQLKAMERDA